MGWSVGRGCPLPTEERVWGGGCAPSPEIFKIFFGLMCSKNFCVQAKGGGHRPVRQNTPLASRLKIHYFDSSRTRCRRVNVSYPQRVQMLCICRTGCRGLRSGVRFVVQRIRKSRVTGVSALGRLLIGVVADRRRDGFRLLRLVVVV